MKRSQSTYSCGSLLLSECYERSLHFDREIKEDLQLRPVVVIISETDEAKAMVDQLNSPLTLNANKDYVQHQVNVNAMLLRLGSSRDNTNHMIARADFVVIPFDGGDEESFSMAKRILLWIRLKNPACHCLLTCFNHAFLMDEDKVYYDLVCCELQCQFQVLELMACGQQVSSMVADYYPRRNKELKLHQRRRSLYRGFIKLRRFLNDSLGSTGSVEE